MGNRSTLLLQDYIDKVKKRARPARKGSLKSETFDNGNFKVLKILKFPLKNLQYFRIHVIQFVPRSVRVEKSVRKESKFKTFGGLAKQK